MKNADGKKKIIFTVEHPYWDRDHHRCGGEYMMNMGYPVEIWRIKTNNSIEFETPAGMYKGDNYFCYTFSEYKRKIDENRDCIYIAINSCVNRNNRELAKRGCTYICLMGLGGVFMLEKGSPPGENPTFRRVKKALKLGPVSVLKILLRILYRKIDEKQNLAAIMKNPPFLLATSTRHTAEIYIPAKILDGNTEYIHCFDYDRYIEANRKSNNRGGKYLLYCDSGFIGKAYDFELSGYVSEISKRADVYYEQLEVLFKALEDHYQLPVVISGHPHTQYEDHAFDGREIVFNQTHELARDAELFIVNTSTAINFALLYNIPVLMIANRSFRQSPLGYRNRQNLNDYYEFIQYEAREHLGCGFLDMDDEEKLTHPWDYVKKADENKRKDHIRKYIIDSDKTEKTVIEYIEEFIRTL